MHFKGYAAKYDEWIEVGKEGARIKEIGLYSGAEGFAKYSIKMQQEIKENTENVNKALKACLPSKKIDSSGGWGFKFYPKDPAS